MWERESKNFDVLLLCNTISLLNEKRIKLRDYSKGPTRNSFGGALADTNSSSWALTNFFGNSISQYLSHFWISSFLEERLGTMDSSIKTLCQGALSRHIAIRSLSPTAENGTESVKNFAC